MKNTLIRLLALILIPCSPAFSQKKLKKSDRQIVANIQAHVNYLNADNMQGRKAGSDGEKLASEYIIKQFAKAGLKPRGDKDWMQTFPIYDGREIKPSSSLKLNEDNLVLYKDYFPFPFSANKSADAAVAIALAENGVPWFKDINEIIDSDDSTQIDTLEVIRTKAKHAAAKGASALIIYNKGGKDLAYNRYDRSQHVEIPVVYITGKAFKKYAADESAIIEVKLNVELEEKSRTGSNIIGYADNGADSTVITSANLDKENDVAALLEVARLMKSNKSKSKNYMFITYCGEKGGDAGEDYFRKHLPVNMEPIKRTLELDSLAATVDNPKDLNLVKRSIEIIKN